MRHGSADVARDNMRKKQYDTKGVQGEKPAHAGRESGGAGKERWRRAALRAGSERRWHPLARMVEREAESGGKFMVGQGGAACVVKEGEAGAGPGENAMAVAKACWGGGRQGVGKGDMGGDWRSGVARVVDQGGHSSRCF